MDNLIEVLSHYNIKGEIAGSVSGPLITQIKFRPQAGTKIGTLTAALEDIRRELGVSSLRIGNTCGENCIGFEIPNDNFATVGFSGIIDSEDFKNIKGNLPLNLGVGIDGRPIFADLAKMPHLLVAGSTGSGKSVALNAFILSLTAAKTPEELQFVLIDPKRIEFSIYNDQKYLLMPVITDNAQSAEVLRYLADEMNRRYDLLAANKVRNIAEYHQTGRKMPYIVVIIDEFADLILSDKSVEAQIQILAQKARAAGIHLILATQRPSVDVVSGSIKANFPARIAFKTASRADSQTIIDTTGAQDLIGRGDALYLAADGTLTRIHGAYVSQEEVESFLRPYRQKTEYPQALKAAPVKNTPAEKKKKEPFFLWVWLVSLWNYLGKREQKKLLKMLFETFFGKKKS